ncbi:MAG: helix-turn-helix domain-containing protein, partial [Thermoanaerobaculia bacterium]|nr:helix-turn-helix domain-containing protein [Thermoanaerobaculia bacterium]
MGRGRPKKPLELTEDERRTLSSWASRPKSSQRLALRSNIVLACAEGIHNTEVAQRLGVTPTTVGKWRERFCPTSTTFVRDDNWICAWL